MPSFTSGQVEIAFTDTGAGRPILLIHGFASNISVNWQGTGWLRTLGATGRRIVAMDVRGHGRSGKPHEPAAYRPALMALDAARLLDHLSIGAADVMGYSMGARIAAYLAMSRPDLVRSLVFGGMATGMIEGIGDEDEIVAALEAEDAGDVIGETGRSYRKFADQTGGDLKALAACMRSQRELISRDAISSIEAPVLIAVGTQDSVAGSPDQLASMMAHARVVAIPDRDHLQATGDRVYKTAVLAFLNELDGKPN